MIVHLCEQKQGSNIWHLFRMEHAEGTDVFILLLFPCVSEYRLHYITDGSEDEKMYAFFQ